MACPPASAPGIGPRAARRQPYPVRKIMQDNAAKLYSIDLPSTPAGTPEADS